MKQSSSFLLFLGLIVVLLNVGVLSGCVAGAKGPTVTGVNPSSAEVGGTLDVTITGTDFTDASAVSFGEGITINSYTVDSQTQITANISIDSIASTGSRNVSATTSGGTGTKSGGFTVSGPPEIPRISVGEVKAKLDEGSYIVVVDVRSKAAYDMDHIVGSISIPLSDLFDAQGNPLSSEVITQRYSDLQRYDEIITSCE